MKILNVLLVEDHAGTRDRLKAICNTEFKADVEAACDRETVKALVASRDFDIILWDHNVAHADTLKLIKAARERFPNAKMIASAAMARQRREQMKAGCNIDCAPGDVFSVLRNTIMSYRK